MKDYKPVTNLDSLDILEMMIDAFELLYPEKLEFSESYSVIPPEYMVNAAKKGIKLRDKQPNSNKCCTPTGTTRANQLANKENLSISTVKRIKSFASRHGANIDGMEKDSKQMQALLMWGIPGNRAGIDKVIAWADREIQKWENSKKK